jgi:hypothetical protein
MATITHYFTFGQNHMTNFPLPRGGRLADYWVAVEIQDEDIDDDYNHRYLFVQEFSSKYCPTPNQFAFEYTDETFKGGYFPNGELTRIK